MPIPTDVYKRQLYNKVVKFLKENDPEMIYIYGGDDPWTASGVTWLKNKKNIKVYVLPGGSHTTRIGSFDTDTQEEIKTQINAWLKDVYKRQVQKEQDSILADYQPYFQIDKEAEKNVLSKLREDYNKTCLLYTSVSRLNRMKMYTYMILSVAR